jgi:hypothetical protein
MVTHPPGHGFAVKNEARARRRARPGGDRIGWMAIATGCLSPCWLACGSDDAFVPIPVPDAGAVDASVQDPATGDAAQDATSRDGIAAPTVVLLRIANWSPDSPPVDACITIHGSGSYGAPIVAALASSSDAGSPTALAFPFVSAYVSLAPGQYDVRIVAGGAVDCSVGIGTDATSLPVLVAGDAETVALVGEAQTTGTDPALQIVGLLDDVTSTAPVALRCVNAAPALPRIDLGTGTLAASTFKPLFQGVLFGHASSAQESAAAADGSAPAVDSNGYETIRSVSYTTLSTHVSTGTTDGVSTTGLSAASGSVVTIAVVDGTSAETPQPTPKILECVDNAGTVGSLSSCHVLP